MSLFNRKKTAHKHEAPPKAPGRGRKIARTLLLVLLILSAAVCAVVAGYSLWEKPPVIDTHKDDVAATPTPSAQPGQEIVVETTPAPEEMVDEYEGALDTERDDGVYTFLLVGRDHASNSTDTIIVGKMDTVNHTLDAVNIPRDTLINISWGNTPKKINTVYPGYTNSGKSGIDGLKNHVKNLTGFDVDCYAVVNLKVVEDVINEIGGVYFDVPMDMDYDDGSQHFHVHLKQGYQLLNGYEALGVFRYRYGNDGGTYPGGDLQRIGVQQDLMKSIAGQMLSLGNIPNLSNIIQLCLDNVETDLDASNIAFFARQFLLCKMENINFHTAPTACTCLINDINYVSLDVNGWLTLVNERLNPYTEAVTTANVNILTSNAGGTAMSATTGVIAGGDDSFYCNNMECTMRFSYHLPQQHVIPVDEPLEDAPLGGGEDGTPTDAPNAGSEGAEENSDDPYADLSPEDQALLESLFGITLP